MLSVSLSTFWRSWSPFWLRQGPSWQYSIFRLLWFPHHWSFGLWSLWITYIERDLPPLPYSGLGVVSLIPPLFAMVLSLLHLFSSFFVLLGWKTRFFQWVLAFLSPLLFFRSASLYQNHYAFYLFITFYLAFAPTERYYSIDALHKRRTLSSQAFQVWQSALCPLLAQRLILLQAGFLYLFAGLTKLDPLWLTRWSAGPEVLMLSEGHPLQGLWAFFVDQGWTGYLLSMVGYWMVFLSVGIFLGRRYPVILLVTATMHLLFELSFTIMEFTWMFLPILFLALFPPLKGGVLDRFVRFFCMDNSLKHSS